LTLFTNITTGTISSGNITGRDTATFSAETIKAGINLLYGTTNFGTKIATIETSLNGNQSTLVAGDNITIDGNTISSTAGSDVTQEDLDLKQDTLSRNSHVNISSLIVSNDAFSINTIVPGQVNCSSLVVGDVDIDTKKDNAISNASNAVYFKARGGTNITINNGDILQYNTIIFNEGGGYNNSTYKFTAPVTGLYHFIISFISSSSFATEVDIYQYDGVERIIERIKGSGIKNILVQLLRFIMQPTKYILNVL